MDPVEVTLADGSAIFSFDGRVFEYFGSFGLGGGTASPRPASTRGS
jgi:hypothetical protein